MTFQDLWNELIGHVPSLSPFLAQRFINRAWRDIRQIKSWSFQIAEGFLIVPTVITTGTVSVTQYSRTVTPNATAIAALDVAGTHPLLGERQFRLAPGTRIYNIESYDSTTITLVEEYQEVTANSQNYQVFRCFFKPPTSDFIRFISIRDLITNYHIRLNYTQEELNRTDPQRNTTGDPLYCSSYKSDSSGNPLFELWPGPSSNRSYQVLYQKRGADLSSGESLPLVIPDHLVLDRAMYYAYRWAEENKGGDPKLQMSDWRFLMAQVNKDYMDELRKTIREDEDVFMQTIHIAESRTGFMTPIDANYAQNHVVDWM